jgi:hypothetical protein
MPVMRTLYLTLLWLSSTDEKCGGARFIVPYPMKMGAIGIV